MIKNNNTSVPSDKIKFAKLVELIENSGNTQRTVVAIDGMCAAGKTSASKYLSELFSVPVIHTDDFFLSQELRTPDRLCEVGGNTDYKRFLSEVVMNLKSGCPFAYGKFDCHSGKIVSEVIIPQSDVIIIEGSYSLHPIYGKYYDISAFLEVSPSEQMKRIMRRNGLYAEMFKSHWIPLENAYFEKFCIKEHADIIIDCE